MFKWVVRAFIWTPFVAFIVLIGFATNWWIAAGTLAYVVLWLGVMLWSRRRRFAKRFTNPS